jgi:hypothetical protein
MANCRRSGERSEKVEDKKHEMVCKACLYRLSGGEEKTCTHGLGGGKCSECGAVVSALALPRAA